MKFVFHWLRRDLRRHAPLLALWALLVALFTWARVWFRTHPEVMIGDRDLWLSLPAAGLGFAEVCLLLRVLLDDPARGAGAFWKTRPPSGAAVFGAKLGIVGLTALVIPLTAEAVFLAVVGMSGGGAERFSLVLLPPLLAGSAAVNWRTVLLWLPLVLALAAVLVVAWCLLALRQTIIAADHRLCVGAALLAAVLVAAWAYRRRTVGLVFSATALMLPALAAAGMAVSGWLADPRLTTPPPGKAAVDFPVTWRRPPALVRDAWSPGGRLNLPLGIPALDRSEFAIGELSSVTIQFPDREETLTALRAGRRQRVYWLPTMGNDWLFPLDDALAASLRSGPWTVRGTLRLRCFDRQRHILPLKGTHTVASGCSRWRITPVAEPATRFRRYWNDDDVSALFYQWEFVSSAPRFAPEPDRVDLDTACLRRESDGVAFPMNTLHISSWARVWQGSGYGVAPLPFDVPLEERRPWEEFRREFSDPARQEEWTLEFDTLTFSGVLELPFSLSSPGVK